MAVAEAPGASVLSLFRERGRHRRLAVGEVLFHEGDDTSSVYECLSGQLRLIVAASDGRELLLDVALPGDIFGEISAIDGGGRSATATAIVPSVVVELSGAEYLAALRGDAVLALASLRSLTRQIRSANARICAGETETVASRAAHLLADLVARFGGGETASQCSTVPITQADLAEWLGASREATARALAELRRAGVITTGRSLITVNDRDALVSWRPPAH